MTRLIKISPRDKLQQTDMTSQCSSRTRLLVTSFVSGIVTVVMTLYAMNSARWIRFEALPHDDVILTPPSAQVPNESVTVEYTSEELSRQLITEFCFDLEMSKTISNDDDCVVWKYAVDTHSGLWTTCGTHKLEILCGRERCQYLCSADQTDNKHRLQRHLANGLPLSAGARVIGNEQTSATVAAILMSAILTSCLAILIGISILMHPINVMIAALVSAMLHASAGLMQLVSLFVYVSTNGEEFAIDQAEAAYHYDLAFVSVIGGFLSANVAAVAAGCSLSAASAASSSSQSKTEGAVASPLDQPTPDNFTAVVAVHHRLGLTMNMLP